MRGFFGNGQGVHVKAQQDDWPASAGDGHPAIADDAGAAYAGLHFRCPVRPGDAPRCPPCGFLAKPSSGWRCRSRILTLTPDAAYNIGAGTGTATIIDDNDDNNDVLVRYIFTDANSTGSTFSLAAQVYSTNVSATAIAAAAGIGVGNSGTAVSPPNAGYINSTVTTSNQTEAIANDDYFSFTLTPTIGNSLTLTNLELSARILRGELAGH